jgi:hypothetical protein
MVPRFKFQEQRMLKLKHFNLEVQMEGFLALLLRGVVT